MTRSRDRNRVCLRVRVTTRLAWLDITHVDFAEAINMDKSTLSKTLRADSPRSRTLKRIALGLGLKVSDLTASADPAALTSEHPANDRALPRKDRAASLQSWYARRSAKAFPQMKSKHRTEDERHERRMVVRAALAEDRFKLEFIRETAKKYGVSASQIYADRTLIQQTEGGQ